MLNRLFGCLKTRKTALKGLTSLNVIRILASAPSVVTTLPSSIALTAAVAGASVGPLGSASSTGGVPFVV